MVLVRRRLLANSNIGRAVWLISASRGHNVSVEGAKDAIVVAADASDGGRRPHWRSMKGYPDWKGVEQGHTGVAGPAQHPFDPSNPGAWAEEAPA